MPQSEAEKLVEEVARKICLDMGEDPDCPTPYNPHVDFLWQFSLPTARAVTALIVERCALEARDRLRFADTSFMQDDAICASIGSLSPTQPEAKEASHAD